MGLPFEPETERTLKARFAAATERVWEPERMKAGGPRPGTQRRHVFDYHDGTRLVVSRDVVGGEVALHVSVSFHKGTGKTGEAMVRAVVDKVNALRGETVPGLVKAFDSGDGVAHFLFPEPLPEFECAVVPPFPNAN